MIAMHTSPAARPARPAEAPVQPGIRLRRLLVAYDGSAAARRALELAAEIAPLEHGSIDVISVVPIFFERSRPRATDGTGDLHALHLDYLREAEQMLAERGLEADLILAEGEPDREIEAAASRGRYDAVVIGSRRLGTLARLALGSVSEHVVTHTDRTVIVAR